MNMGNLSSRLQESCGLCVACLLRPPVVEAWYLVWWCGMWWKPPLAHGQMGACSGLGGHHPHKGMLVSWTVMRTSQKSVSLFPEALCGLISFEVIPLFLSMLLPWRYWLLALRKAQTERLRLSFTPSYWSKGQFSLQNPQGLQELFLPILDFQFPKCELNKLLFFLK